MLFLYTFTHLFVIIINEEIKTSYSKEVFAILTKGCAIRGFPHVSDTIRNFVGLPENEEGCCDTDPLVKANLSHVWLDKERLSYYGVWNEDNLYCCYKNFSAITNVTDIIYESCKEFSTSLKVEHEYVRTECYFEGDKIYDGFFLFNLDDNISSTAHNEAAYNILMLGFESLSRINFHRTMPLTSQFLQDHSVIELFGYNKLGDNSFPNLFPLLTGKSYDYVKKNCFNYNTKIFNFDKCEFIWDKFKEREYFTALGSDSIAGLLGDYEYSFPIIPTYFYIQPFIYETRNVFSNKYYNYHQCMGSEYYFKILLDYIFNLAQKLNLNKLFGLFWEESISHEYLNKPHIMDEAYYNLLTSLNSVGYLNKTILILLSDHGMRWGDIVHTEQGRLEERLPLLEILLPKKFRQRYKLAYKNVQENANRLVTPFDVYETLLHLLDQQSLSNQFIRQKTNLNISVHSHSSLFLPISERRTCQSIGIEEHWCACYKGKKILPGPKMEPLISEILINYINNLVKKFPNCVKLTLEKILHVSLIEGNKSWRIYTVIVQTNPGGGVFDGTLLRSHTSWKVSGTVSRLNRYGNQSSCIEDLSVKMYCFCG